MKLTPELINRSPTFINAIKDRELDLRGNKIPLVENLGVTKDQNDTIDLTDNDLRHLTNFPLLKRLKTLLCSNNRIARIESNLAMYLPNLQTLVMTNNNISELGDLEILSQFKKLEYISLLDNPVQKRPHYRYWVIYLCKTLRVLDFQRVRLHERQAAKELFESKDGSGNALADQIRGTKTKTFEVDVNIGTGAPTTNLPALGITPEEQAKIKEAIKNATSYEEITRLERQLQSGQIPEAGSLGQSQGKDIEMEEEED